jgi:hypothetical protein
VYNMKYNRLSSRGVSIITCTKRPKYIENLLNNYNTQIWSKKELIIILNNDSMSLKRYRNMCKQYKNISVYRLPQSATLGKCLNFATRKAKYGYVAKFDDDDYYAPRYIQEIMKAFARTNADVVGKFSIFTYLQHRKLLLLCYPNKENRFVQRVGGGTITFKKRLFRYVKFPNITLGEDVQFQRLCRAKGFKIYSTSRYNFVGIRRKNSMGHTWRISDRNLIQAHKIIAATTNYRAYCTKSAIRSIKRI